MNIIKSIQNLTTGERCLWIGSMLAVLISAVAFPNPDWLSVATSLVGATALIFVGKGDPIGQLICIVFSLFYAAVSWYFRYYGEMITYLCMSTPASAWALVTWIKHPYAEREVKVAEMTGRKWALLSVGALVVTVVMYFVLRYCGTANLIVSTLSVSTSVMASALLILRSPYYALWYAANDIVLIVLWVLATIAEIGYLPMVICFLIFLINDTYGFINWCRMKKKQTAHE